MKRRLSRPKEVHGGPRPDCPPEAEISVLIHAGNIVLKEARRPMDRHLPTEHGTDSLQGHLHGLAERMQSASFYIEALMVLARQTSGLPAIDAAVLEKAAQQLDHAREEFQNLCAFLSRKEGGTAH